MRFTTFQSARHFLLSYTLANWYSVSPSLALERIETVMLPETHTVRRHGEQGNSTHRSILLSCPND